MKFRHQMVSVLGALALSFGGASVSADAKARQCTSAECACEKALERNTVEALEEFLRKYQHDASVRTTACAALSMPAEGESAEQQKAEYSAEPDLPTE